MKRMILPVLALCLLLSGCSSLFPEKKASRSLFALDTDIVITLYGTQDDAPIENAFDEIRRLEKLLSAHLEDSDIDRINKAAGVRSVTVSNDTRHVLKRAMQLSAISEGTLDITAGPLIDLWAIGQGGDCVPAQEEIERCMALLDMDGISVSGNDVMLASPGMAIDLGAIAKGYVGERVKSVLKENGVENAIIDLGGNVIVMGTHKAGAPFVIGIQDPFADGGTAIASLSVTDKSIVTSGAYERFIEVDGVRYHHILDPGTGFPAKSGLASATIITEDSETADALSTAVFILGAEKGMTLIESMADTECLLVTETGGVLCSSGIDDSVTIYD